MGRAGALDFTGPEWTDAGATATFGCNLRQHLYCLQTSGSGGVTFPPVLPPPRDPDAIVMFVVPSGTGSYVGATAAGLTETYVAFVSTTSVGGRDRSRLDGPVYRPDGWRVAADVDLFTQLLPPLTLETTLAQSASGAMLTGNRAAWTGFPTGGIATANSTGGETCIDWTSTAPG
jgi:hypothetical protein